MMNAKIGVMIPVRPETDIDNEFKKAADLDLDCCQVSIWKMNMYTEEVAEQLKAASAKHGVEIVALWAGWSGPCEWNFTFGPSTLGLVPPAYRGMRVAELKNASDFAEKIGVTNVVTHAGFMPENPDDPNFQGTIGALRDVCKYMGKKGQTFLFETGQETPVTMLRAIEAIGMENVGINFDTANLILYGKANAVDALDVFGKYVRNTHCKDGLYPTCGSELGAEVPMGEGKANFPAIVAKLNELGYDGPYIIEREIKGEKQVADIQAGKQLLESIFATI